MHKKAVTSEMNSFQIRFLMIASLFLFLFFPDVASAKPIPYEVWSRGDDGLTQRFRDALEHAFEASPDFEKSFGKKPGTLIVFITDHLGWEKFENRMKVEYSIEFSFAGSKDITTEKGTCWENAFAGCAAKIVRDAKIATQKMRKEEHRNANPQAAPDRGEPSFLESR
jgi:hypothetical protein